MFHRILVPLDGSDRAERALPLAVRLAAASGGSLLLVRVASESYYAPASLSFVYDTADGLVAPVAEAEAYLQAVAARSELANVPVTTLASIGTPAVEILEASRNNAVDAIVMCSHGRTGLAKWAMGSVAQKVSRHAPVPVLVVKESAPVPAALSVESARDLRVLIPLDGSPHAEATIAPALSLVAGIAAGKTAEIHLLRVVDLTTIYGHLGVDARDDQAVRTALTESAQTYMSAMAEHVRGQLPTTLSRSTVSWSVATGVDPAVVIVETAEGHPPHAADTPARAFDVTAMATHGRGGVGLWAVGSVTERVLTTSSLPLLIVRPPRERSRSEVPTEVHEAPSFPPLL